MNRLLSTAAGAVTTLIALSALAAPSATAATAAPAPRTSADVREQQPDPAQPHSVGSILNTSWGDCWRGPDCGDRSRQ
ncbi:hypothetical protein AB0D08_21560 [Kitasatospora sp. NPDC048540]|uniref:hypothetical protein n=1 Tax=unclassified Kitasatospora TaxID=2633591 RepID=UPI00053A51D5|nr:hypothetical protein [Kitasatospora sp. MBT63]